MISVIVVIKTIIIIKLITWIIVQTKNIKIALKRQNGKLI